MLSNTPRMRMGEVCEGAAAGADGGSAERADEREASITSRSVEERELRDLRSAGSRPAAGDAATTATRWWIEEKKFSDEAPAAAGDLAGLGRGDCVAAAPSVAAEAAAARAWSASASLARRGRGEGIVTGSLSSDVAAGSWTAASGSSTVA